MDRPLLLSVRAPHAGLGPALRRTAAKTEKVVADETGAIVLWSVPAQGSSVEHLLWLTRLHQTVAGGRPVLLLSSLHACLPPSGTALERSAQRPFDPLDEIARLRERVDHEMARADFADERVEAERAVRVRHEKSRAPITGPGFAQAATDEAHARANHRVSAWVKARAQAYGYAHRAGYWAALAEGLLETGPGTTSTGIVRCGLVWPENRDDQPVGLDDLRGARVDGRRKVIAVSSSTLAHLVWSVADQMRTGPQAVVVHAAMGPDAVMSEARVADLVSLHTQGAVKRPADLAREVAMESVRVARNNPLLRRWVGQASPLRALLGETSAKPRARVDSTVFFAPTFRPLARKATALLKGRGPNTTDGEQVDLRRRVLDVVMPLAEAPERADVRPAPPVRYTSVVHMLQTAADRFATRNALSVFEGEQKQSVTYQALLRRARQTATRLQAAGVQPGDRVVLAGQNGPAWPIAFFGIQIAGAQAVPLDPGLDPAQVATIVHKARPVGALLDVGAAKKFGPAAGETVWDLSLFTKEGGVLCPVPSPSADDVASILFTSGTTGTPKGVMLTHKNFCAQAASLSLQFDMTGEDRALSVLPLHHTLEFACGLLLPLVAGAEIFYLDELNAERLAFVLREGRITGMVGVPALWQLLERKIRRELDALEGIQKTALGALSLVEKEFEKRTGRSAKKLVYKPVHDALGGHLWLLISGGAALPQSTHALFAEVGLPLREGYGLTETAPVLSVASEDDGPGTVGRPIHGVELRIDGDGDTGEILARGDNVMKGYFEDPDATAAVLSDDGWLRTGDLGRFDEEGRLCIVGRAKDVVVTASGENIYLDDVEELLRPFPQVAEFCLVGVPDESGGELLALAVVPDEGVVLTASEAKRHTGRLPAYARPAVVEVFDEVLPKTATRKIKRKDVRALVEERRRTRPTVDHPTEAVTSVLFARVQAAVALVASVDRATLLPSTHLHTDLGFDSLMWVELSEALGPIYGHIDAEALFGCDTLADLERLLSGDAPARAEPAANPDAETAEPVALPRFFVQAGRAALRFSQREIYRTLFDSDVEGRANIPYNENVIVVANHCSHLDTGLVKFALGRYGTQLLPLAAADYFFEGTRAKVAFFEHFTNLVALDRTSGSGSAFEVARDLLTEGHQVLIYPEGTRRADGTLGPFKPLVGRLSMATGRSILPVALAGTYDALPRGSAVPKARSLRAKIGQPITADALRAVTAHRGPVEAAKAATEHVRETLVAMLADDDSRRGLNRNGAAPSQTGPARVRR